ncbi:MAG: hypothetical protein IT198_07835 [Acidimicrobiia bacterium]|nr:hypothetical protein [Acidimicrobiia bacterium]
MRRLTHTLAFLIGLAVVLVSIVGVGPEARADVGDDLLDDSVVHPTTARDLPLDFWDADLTLREAVLWAEFVPDIGTIELRPGVTYELTMCGNAPEDANESGDLDTQESFLTIAGTSNMIRQNCPGERVLHMLDGDVQLTGTTLTGGRTGHFQNGGGVYAPAGFVLMAYGAGARNNSSGGSGGGVFAREGVMLVESRITSNTALNAGGVWSGDQINVIASTVADNTASGSGGGIVSVLGAWLTGSTLSGNRARNGGGGGILSFSEISTENVTISGNSATVSGGAISASRTAHLRWSTVVDNSAPRGANVTAMMLESYASVVGVRRGGGTDCRLTNPTNSLGYNIAGDNSCGFRGPTDRVVANPLVGALAENGGRTQTRMPLAGSPLLNVVPGNPQACDMRWDQRDVARPRPAGGACDIGAVER